MDKYKQEFLVRCFTDGRYRADGIAGTIVTKKRAGEKALVPVKLPTGYQQVIMYYGPRGLSKKIVVYVHVAVWIGCNGVYDSGMEIDHRDGNPSNNAVDNLRLCTSKKNCEYKMEKEGYVPPNKDATFRPIRGAEIALIREGVANNLSQSEIARQLNLNRLSVRNVINKIKKGEVLKFENWKEPGDKLVKISKETGVGLVDGQDFSRVETE